MQKESIDIKECSPFQDLDPSKTLLTFTCYTEYSPSKGDIIKVENSLYLVESVLDDTDEEEAELGLSYSKINLTKL